MRLNTSKFLALVICTAGLLLGPSQSCHGGGLLPIPFDPNAAAFLGANGLLSYNVANGEVHSTASALALTFNSQTQLGGADFAGLSGQIDTDFFVNQDGSFRANGSGFALTGILSYDGTNLTGTLLTGNFTNDGPAPAGPPTWTLDALFDVSGGLLTQPNLLANGATLPAQFAIGGQVGIDFFAENRTSGTLGDFTASFSGKIKDQGGPVSIAEPSSWALAMIAVVVLSLFGLNKKRPAPAS